ncbi:hypothetical protein GH714_038242 [Hevea brasiliensis]|uniref:Uncharacterized protein n=1 Tax=Hevea brasiliensis TaxID=3981 RepID=A0A6A6LEY8_HEVBR|nr:hypothetical protein GH714_038242 [Hevea brasiliensis]
MYSLCRAGHSRSVHSSNSGKPLMQSSLRLGSLPTVRILQFMQFLKLCLGKRKDGSSEDEIYKVYSNKEDSTDEDIANCSGKDEFFTTLESSYVDEELRNAKETMRDLKKKKGANKEDKAANQELKDNLKELAKLGKGTCEDLLSYPAEDWVKVYHSPHLKCDVVKNNTCGTFNSLILSARHKSIIMMLEEIRVKIMNRIRTMRDFAQT